MSIRPRQLDEIERYEALKKGWDVGQLPQFGNVVNYAAPVVGSQTYSAAALFKGAKDTSFRGA